MTKGTQYGAYNARWLLPEEVARTFVPLKSFSKLVREGHAVLMGPRGCGKTTLLKMLTRKALNEWYNSSRCEKYPVQVKRPSYEAIYVPSDVRWLYEIRDINVKPHDERIKEQLQRVMISASVLDALLYTLNTLVADSDLADTDRNKCEIDICESLIDLWKIPKAIPSFTDVGTRIDEMVSSIRGMIKFNHDDLVNYLNKIPPLFYSNALDAPILSCKRINAFLPSHVRPAKWALCFDELEIAPSWLHEELLTSLRSVDQSFFLKLTWSPILPRASSAPEPSSDFTVIRLWNSHLRDPISFCEDLTDAFLHERFPSQKITSDQFLGDSFFASEDENIEYSESYLRQTAYHSSLKNLAEIDRSFNKLLMDRGIDPNNPLPPKDKILRSKQLNEFFRKAKPIVLLREAFLKPELERRTRKSVTLYNGKQAIFAVSEGNPRWLLSLLNDLSDVADYSSPIENGSIKVKPGKQAMVINAASRRFMALIKATPVARNAAYDSESITLYDFINNLAKIFESVMLGDEFPLDPIGSIRFGPKIPPFIEPIVKRAIEIGALVHIGKSPEDVPSGIINERFRLSFMICPSYKLPLRNYKDMALDRSGLIRKRSFRKNKVKSDIEQIGLGFEE